MLVALKDGFWIKATNDMMREMVLMEVTEIKNASKVMRNCEHSLTRETRTNLLTAIAVEMENGDGIIIIS